MTERSIEVVDEAAMSVLAAELAGALRAGALVFVEGELGAGKTTLVRGMLHALGHRGAVPSPTFTLLEPYRIGELDVVHADLYRLQSADELEMLGMRDFLGTSLCLVEWPERAAGALPAPDLRIRIQGSGDAPRLVTVASRS